MVRILLILCLLQPGLVLANSLFAEVDREQIQAGEIINLRIFANFQTTQQPDFSSLKPNFEVLGTQAASQLQLINGDFSATTEWISQLIARKTGDFTIPSFQLEGATSKPIQIQVIENKQLFNTEKIAHLEAVIDNPNPYVQAEVLLTLRFYYVGQMIKGNFNQEIFPDILHERLQGQANYQTLNNGKNYHVIERIYALFPQKSGAIEIPAQEFNAEIFDSRQLLTINQRSKPIKLTVKPIPESYPADQKWLPAKNLELSESWQIAADLQQHDTIKREIKLSAKGLKSSQLTEINWPKPQGFRLYSEPAKNHEEYNKRGIFSSKIQANSLVLDQIGVVEIPALEISWWNTETDQLEVAKLAAKNLQIGKTGQQTNSDLSKDLNADSIADLNPELTAKNAITRPGYSNIWFWLSLIFAGLWLISSWLYLTKLRQKSGQNQADNQTNNQQNSAEKSAQTFAQNLALDQVFKQNLSNLEFYNSIMKHLKREYKIQTLAAIKPLNSTLYQQLIDLDQVLFANQKTTNKTELTSDDKTAIQQQLINLNQQKTNQNSASRNQKSLADLYPT